MHAVKPPPFLFVLALCFVLALPAGAQSGGGETFFFGPLAETALFSVKSAAFGGGLIAAYGYNAGAIGLKAAWFADTGELNTLEMAVFLRFYIPPRGGAGFFIQLDGGSSLFSRGGGFSLPAGAGGVSAGLSAGWRFLLGRHWFVEPYLRAGYPYIAGAGASAGFRL
ncbi:MAG: hypothetical protein LBQ14_07730 [Treponema sp.]|jgi:hypothetical protein|nr:hypothetical protein [Treponema sp.]